jgi:hypothetical protein
MLESWMEVMLERPEIKECEKLYLVVLAYELFFFLCVCDWSLNSLAKQVSHASSPFLVCLF